MINGVPQYSTYAKYLQSNQQNGGHYVCNTYTTYTYSSFVTQIDEYEYEYTSIPPLYQLQYNPYHAVCPVQPVQRYALCGASKYSVSVLQPYHFYANYSTAPTDSSSENEFISSSTKSQSDQELFSEVDERTLIGYSKNDEPLPEDLAEFILENESRSEEKHISNEEYTECLSILLSVQIPVKIRRSQVKTLLGELLYILTQGSPQIMFTFRVHYFSPTSLSLHRIDNFHPKEECGLVSSLYYRIRFGGF